MLFAVVLLAVVNVVIWGYIALWPDYPEIAERDPFTRWLRNERWRRRPRTRA